MGIMVYSLLWVMQDFVHQPYFRSHYCRYSIMLIITAIVVSTCIIVIVTSACLHFSYTLKPQRESGVSRILGVEI